MPWNRDREWKVKWKCLEIEIENWNRKKILENSRDTRLSQGTAGGNFLPGHLVVTTPPPVPRPFYPDAAHLVSPVHQDRSWEIWNLHPLHDVKQSVSLLGGVHLLLVSDLLPVHHKHLLLLGTWDSSLTLPFLCSSGSICFLTKKSRLKAPRCTKNLAGPKVHFFEHCSKSLWPHPPSFWTLCYGFSVLLHWDKNENFFLNLRVRNNI